LFKGPGQSLSESQPDAAISEKKVRLTFYEDGFTAALETAVAEKPAERRRGLHTYESSKEQDIFDLPPLRDYGTNKKFIEDVKASRVPEEFRGPWRVSILLDDKRPTTYPRVKSLGGPSAFSGSGQSLGGGSNAGSSSAMGVVPTPSGNTRGQRMFPQFLPAAIAYDIVVWALLCICKLLGLSPSVLTNSRQRQRPAIDESKPTTTISFKLASGARVQSKFNSELHTVADIRRFVEYEMVQATGCDIGAELPAFELVSGFPPRIVAEGTPDADGSSLAQAGLLKAVITQRLMQSQHQQEHPKSQ